MLIIFIFWFEFVAGLSIKSQELTAMFLAVRLYCSFVMEYDIHTLLDLATLATTLWVIYMIRFNLKSSYMEDKDNFAIYYVVSLCSYCYKDPPNDLLKFLRCYLLGLASLFVAMLLANS